MVDAIVRVIKVALSIECEVQGIIGWGRNTKSKTSMKSAEDNTFSYLFSSLSSLS